MRFDLDAQPSSPPFRFGPRPLRFPAKRRRYHPDAVELGRAWYLAFLAELLNVAHRAADALGSLGSRDKLRGES